MCTCIHGVEVCTGIHGGTGVYRVEVCTGVYRVKVCTGVYRVDMCTGIHGGTGVYRYTRGRGVYSTDIHSSSEAQVMASYIYCQNYHNVRVTHIIKISELIQFQFCYLMLKFSCSNCTLQLQFAREETVIILLLNKYKYDKNSTSLDMYICITKCLVFSYCDR